MARGVAVFICLPCMIANFRSGLLIMAALIQSKDGLTITQLQHMTGLTRLTLGKQIIILEDNGSIVTRRYGQHRLCLIPGKHF